jgi:predicted metal-dependent hydrolase
MPKILLSGHSFEYQIERKPIRFLRIRLKSPHSFIVSCHSLTPNFIITKFISGHSAWIVKNSSKIKIQKPLFSINQLSILGVDHKLIITKSAHDSVVIYEDSHQIYINTISLRSGHLRSLLDKKLRPLALKLIKSELSHLSSQYSFKYGHVSVRNQTSRFGSCSSRGNLNFNWQIIFFPPDKFRHILLHELTHLSIKDHSKKFWSQLSIFDSNYKTNNLWLRKEGQKLMIFSV